MIYDLSVIPEYFFTFLPALWMTIKLTVTAIIIGTLIGLVFAFGKLSTNPLFNLPSRLYIHVIRGTPLLLQLFLVYYGLYKIIELDSFTSAAIAFGAHNGAYIAEIIRGAIESINKGQMEAARSLGMSHFQAMRRIILPQAFKRAVPPLGNQLIIALKDSSLASAISIHELLLRSKQLGASNWKFMEFLTIAAIYYLILTTILTFFVNLLERRLRVSD